MAAGKARRRANDLDQKVESRGNSPSPNILVVIALPEERATFHDTVSGRPGWSVPTEREQFLCTYQSSDGPIKVAVRTLKAMGHIEAILETSSAIPIVSPSLVLLVGLAGSMQPDEIGLCDVIISNQAKYLASDKVCSFTGVDRSVNDYIRGSIADLDSARRNGHIVVDHRDCFLESSFLRYERRVVHSEYVDELLSELEQNLHSCELGQLDVQSLPEGYKKLASSNRDRMVRMGWILASNHVVDSREYRDYLNEKNDSLDLDIHRQKGEHDRVKWSSGKLLAVDMESYGVLRAVTAANRPTRAGGCPDLQGGIIVRGISDLCEDKGHLDKHTKDTIRATAVQNATNVALSLIESLKYDAL